MLTHWVTGSLRDATGIYDGGFILCAAMAGAAVVLMGFVRRTQPIGAGF
jgi:hypothetical protein